MTVVATDGKTVAADGLCRDRAGTIVCLSTEKIRKLRDGRIVGLAGTPFDLGPFCRWLEQVRNEPGLSFPEVDKENFDALVLETDGTAYAYNCRGGRSRHDLPTGVGSGMDLAIGAMKAGKTPMQAVEIACESSVYCGGKIMVLELDRPDSDS